MEEKTHLDNSRSLKERVQIACRRICQKYWFVKTVGGCLSNGPQTVLISLLSIVPQAVSEMACDELRAVRLGWAMWREGMMDKAMKSSAASRTTECERSLFDWSNLGFTHNGSRAPERA
jgi:hypothetical protein